MPSTLLDVANDTTLNAYDPKAYKSQLEVYDANNMTEDHRAAINVVGDFRPRPYQVESMNFMLQQTEDGRFVRGLRAALCRHRRGGKTIEIMQLVKLRMLAQVGTYFLVYPSLNQGRKVIWDGIGYNESGNAFNILEIIQKELWDRKDNHLMQLKLKNGSILQIVGAVGVDGTADHLRGTNPIFVVFDEYAAMSSGDCWNVAIFPVLAENGGSAMFTFTPNGKNHAYKLIMHYLKKRKENPKGKYFAEIKTILDTKRHDGSPVISLDDIEELRESGNAEEKIQQEFFCSFDVVDESCYYAEHIERAFKENRIRAAKWDPAYPVFVFWDIGIGAKDKNSALFVQYPNSDEIKIINYLEYSNKGLLEIMPIIDRLEYPVRAHFFPWDITKTDSLTGVTKIQALENSGTVKGAIEKVTRVSVGHGIDLVRSKFSKFVFDHGGCAEAISHIKQYSKKLDKATGEPLPTPKHDEHSHCCDTLRTMACAMEEGLVSLYQKELDYQENSYDYVDSDSREV